MNGLTPQMEGALQFLAARGELQVRRSNRFIFDEVSARTATALERRGLAERRWVGGRDGFIYITEKGSQVADSLIEADADEDEALFLRMAERRHQRRQGKALVNLLMGR